MDAPAAPARDRHPALVAVVPPECRRHDPPPPSPDRPERLDAVRSALDAAARAGLVEIVPGRPASDAEIGRVHDLRYVAIVDRVCESGGGALDVDVALSPGSFDAARHAAGGALAGIEELRGRPAVEAAFVGVRPPGHHALVDRAMGLCVFNNVAIAAADLRATGARVAIIDWDAHHGNGTQAAFANDPEVLFVSMHQVGLFPQTGAVTDRGGPGARDTVLDLPFPPGAGGADFRYAFDEIVAPVVQRFGPDWVLVSAGFDGHRDERWSDLQLTSTDFATLASRCRALAPGPARTVFVLEGGYDLVPLELSVRAVAEALTAVPG